VVEQVIMGGAFTFLDGHYSRKCPLSIAAIAALCCCFATLAVADIVTRCVHQPIFNRCRIFMSQWLPLSCTDYEKPQKSK
jgi:hypothetical protein